MIKTDFFIVGFQKSGTTSLAYWLNEHPEIDVFFEIEYFCSDFHKESDDFHKKAKYYKCRSLSDYKRKLKISSNKIVGDKSPSYLYSKEAAKNIFDYNPNAKIIICIREPLEFLRSWHSHAYLMRHENIKDFNKAITMEKRRKKNYNLIPNTAKHPSYLYYTDMVKFSSQIKRYLELFSSKNIKVILFGDIKKNTVKVYQETLKFLGCRNIEFRPYFKRKNPGGKPRFEFFQNFILNPDNDMKKVIRKILPVKFHGKIWRLLVDINKKRRKEISTDFKLNNSLKRELNLEVIKLNKLLQDYNLVKKNVIKLWGYE